VHGRVESDERVRQILQPERDFGISDAAVVGRLQGAAASQAARLRDWLEAQAAARRKVYGYGAASRVVASKLDMGRRWLIAPPATSGHVAAAPEPHAKAVRFATCNLVEVAAAELSWLANFNCNETQAGVGKNTKLLM